MRINKIDVTTAEALYAMALLCFSAVGIAVYLQEAKGYNPCPLCIAQRYLYLIAGISASIAAFRKKAIPLYVCCFTIALGAIIAIAHTSAVSNPSSSCGIDPVENFINAIPLADWFPVVFASFGACSDVGDLIFGQTIPELSFCLFFSFLLFLGMVVFKESLNKKSD